MEEKSATCPVCGGSQYYKECGFYFCSECQTQSQELHEHVHEYSVGDASGTRRVKKSSNTEKEKSDDTDEWTSWEYYNFILKGLVDELIGLGSKKTIKVVVLQLWATYLKKLDVAFTSKKHARLPKLGINYHPRDAKLVYGCDVEERKRCARKTRKRRVSERDPTTLSVASNYIDPYIAKLNLRKTKKALFEEDYGKYAESSVDAMSEFDESMRSLDTSSRGQLTSDHETVPKFPRLSFSSAARKLRSQMYKKNGSAQCKSSSSKSISSCKVLKSTNPNILSRIKLLAILYIALRILQEDIQLSDILRWVEEGELSFYEITHFFPDDVKLRGHDLVTFGLSTKKPSYSGLSRTAKELAFYLHVTHIPVPDLLSLAKRYIEELQLPVEIGKYVECIMALSPPSMKFKKSLKRFPNYEGRAMAFIIFVLKLLLGLDGKTEYEISKVTKKLNELCEGSAGIAKLFVWEEWVQYIECRKSVFGRFHFPTQASHYQEAFNNPNSFVKFWKRMKSKDTKRHNRLLFSRLSKMNPELVSAMKHVFMKLVEEETDDDSTVDFVPSLTPQKANLEAIIASQTSATEIPSPADILKQDFTSSTLQHLIKPEQYIAMARKKGTKIVVQKRSAQNQVKVVTKMKKKFQNSGNGKYMIVDTVKRVQHSRHCKKKNKLLSEAKSKKHSMAGHDTESLTDKLLCPSKTFCRLPRIAESMLLKHLKCNGVCVETGNHLSPKNDRTDDSDTDNSTTSSNCDANPSCPRIAENDSFLRGSEIFGSLPVVAEDILVRRLEKEGISSKLDDKLFHHSRQATLPLAAKKVLLKHLKKCKSKESYLVKKRKYVLYVPYVEYWLNEVNTKLQTFEEFEREVIVEFPSSFRWLIAECARMLQMTVQELYYELLDVEAMHCYLLRPQVESLSEDFKKNVEMYW